MKNAITKAIEGGWRMEGQDKGQTIFMAGNTEMGVLWRFAALDPLFWSSLGKAMGWEYPTEDEKEMFGTRVSWHNRWVSFIDHLAERKSADEFFNDLLK